MEKGDMEMMENKMNINLVMKKEVKNNSQKIEKMIMIMKKIKIKI